MPTPSPEEGTETGNSDWFYRREERSGLLWKRGKRFPFHCWFVVPCECCNLYLHKLFKESKLLKAPSY